MESGDDDTLVRRAGDAGEIPETPKKRKRGTEWRFSSFRVPFRAGESVRGFGISQRLSQNHELSLGNRFGEIMPLLPFSLNSGKFVEVCATGKPDPRETWRYSSNAKKRKK